MNLNCKLVRYIAVPLAVGGLAWLLSGNGAELYQTLQQPALSPPGWVFPIVWTVLYLLMGISSYLIATQDGDPVQRQKALRIYGIQLAVNFFWPILFFRLEAYTLSFVWLVLLWILIVVTIARFEAISPPAAWLLAPYLLWVTFAGYLNGAIALLN